MFSDKNLEQISALGNTPEGVKTQIKNFKDGFPPLTITKAALAGDGIVKYSEAEIADLVAYYEAEGKKENIVKFVPASGAASRMFKELFAFKEAYDGTPEADAAFEANQSASSPYAFFKGIAKFAFYSALDALYQEAHGKSLAEAVEAKEYVEVLELFLTDKGLGYGVLPKGLLLFHTYEDGARTPLEEHMVEGANYANSNGVVNLHFTVSPEHEEKFKARVAEIKAKYEKMFGVSYSISYSQQKKSTDTIAVNMDNTPFREGDDSILFRPAGHGALLENLNDLDCDIVFIKNIDNVVPDTLKGESYTYKKLLAGAMMKVREKIFSYLKELDQGADGGLIEEIKAFYAEELCTAFTPGFDALDLEAQADYVRAKLNRPVRACGMVSNSGETGGGPFWAKNPDASVSLQIAETAQIDKSNPTYAEIFKQSTHFNPADLACQLKDYKGNKFDLLKYRDMKTGFIANKSKGGKDLKAQELPGLWNGSMSDWNTIFVEVPIITFNPVKTVNDLLRDEHQ